MLVSELDCKVYRSNQFLPIQLILHEKCRGSVKIYTHQILLTRSIRNGRYLLQVERSSLSS